MKKKKILVKQFTRDFSLFICEWFRESLQKNFQRAIGACYTDYVIVSDGRSITSYYLTSDLINIKRAFFCKIASDGKWFMRQSRKFRQESAQSRKSITQAVKAGVLNTKVVERFRERHLRLFPMLRLSILIPSIFADEIRAKFGARGEKIIKTAYNDRLKSDGVFELNDYSLRALVSKQLEKIGIPSSMAKFLPASEVLALAKGKKIDLKLIRKLANGFVLCNQGLIPTNNYQKVFSQNNYYFREEKATNSSAAGTVAYSSNIVRGKARLLFALDQIHTFKKGEVLITPMTVPDFLPAMRKARAIVTDEGGITCHAAIVSRELKIPCVIGTKIATKVFKDGDQVEVDAERGVVRKL